MKTKSIAMLLVVIATLVAVFSNSSSAQRPTRTVGDMYDGKQTLVGEKIEYQELYYNNGLEGELIVKAVKEGWEIVCVYNVGTVRKALFKRDRK